jgi:hypothetical protein
MDWGIVIGILSILVAIGLFTLGRWYKKCKARKSFFLIDMVPHSKSGFFRSSGCIHFKLDIRLVLWPPRRGRQDYYLYTIINIPF